MTNALTYSTTSFGSHAHDLLGLHPLASTDQPHYTPRFLSDHTTQVLDNLAGYSQQVQDQLADNAAMFVVVAVVAGLFSMAVAVGLSICV